MRRALLALLFATSSAAADTPEPAPTPAPVPTEAPTPAPTQAPQPVQPKAQPVELDAAPKTDKWHWKVPEPTQGRFANRATDVSHVPAYIMTAVTGGLLVSTLLANHHDNVLWKRADEYYNLDNAAEFRKHVNTVDSAHAWHTGWMALLCASVVSGGVTSYLWSRHEYQEQTGHIDPAQMKDRIPINPGRMVQKAVKRRSPSVALAPASDGGMVVLGGEL
jgi:hypothetical protein